PQQRPYRHVHPAGELAQGGARRRMLHVLDDLRLDAGVPDHHQGVHRGAAAIIVVNGDRAHRGLPPWMRGRRGPDRWIVRDSRPARPDRLCRRPRYSPAMRILSPQQAIKLSVAAALATMAIKAAAWLLTGSVGFLSDALESS